MNPYLLINLKLKYFPTKPKDDESAWDLMEQLPPRLQVILALEASKMVIPIWEEHTSKNKKLAKKYKEFPQKIIKTIENWLAGKSNPIIFNKVIKEVRMIDDEGLLTFRDDDSLYISPATYSYRAVAHAIYAVEAIEDDDAPADPAVHAVYAANGACKYNNYNKWWNRCYPLITRYYDDFCKQINGEV